MPWSKIAGLLALSVPPVVLAASLALPPASAIVGFLTGFLASVMGGPGWALAAVILAVLAYIATMAIPSASYGIAVLLILASALAAPRGGRRALTYAALGWVFLDMAADQNGELSGIVLFPIAGVWAIAAARWLDVSGLASPDAAARRTIGALPVVITTIGFLASLIVAETLPLERPYWVPFVFLQIIAVVDSDMPRRAMERMAGAILGVSAVVFLSTLNLPQALELSLAALGLVAGLRTLTTYPLASKTLITSAIILFLSARGEDEAGARLLAELAGVGVLLAVAGLAAIVEPAGRKDR